MHESRNKERINGKASRRQSVRKDTQRRQPLKYITEALYDGYTENYRRALAAVDRALAERCESVVEVCAGNKIYYKGREWE